MFHRQGNWRGSYVQDLESGRRQYFDSPRAQNRRYYRTLALAAARNIYQYGYPVLAGYAGQKMADYFTTAKKRVRAPQMGVQDVATKKQKISHSKSVVKSKKMVARRRKRSKRTRSVRKRVYKKKYRGKRSKSRRSSKLSSMSIRRMLAPPYTLKQSFSTNPALSAGSCGYFIPDVTHSRWHNNQVVKASGELTQFSGTSNSYDNLITRFNHHMKVTNQQSSDLMIQVTEMYCKRDFKDGDYSGGVGFETRAGQYNAPNAICNWMYASLLSLGDAGTDGQFSQVVADSTNNRYPASVQTTSPILPVFTSQSKIYFGVAKRHRTRVLKPNQSCSYSILDSKNRFLNNHFHILESGSNTPQMYSGRSRFFIVKMWGQDVGTSEAEGAGADDRKINTAGVTAAMTWSNTITLRKLSPHAPQLDYSEYRPAISTANVEFIGDVDEDPIAPEVV